MEGDREKEKLPEITMDHSERASFIPENDDVFESDPVTPEEKLVEPELRDIGGALNSPGRRVLRLMPL